jgi:hypothetical protein
LSRATVCSVSNPVNAGQPAIVIVLITRGDVIVLLASDASGTVDLRQIKSPRLAELLVDGFTVAGHDPDIRIGRQRNAHRVFQRRCVRAPWFAI